MNKTRLMLAGFCAFLGLVIYAADVGAGPRYWGWLAHVPLGDKMGHFSLMFTLSTLANLALDCRRVRWGGGALFLGTAIVTVLVVGEEFSQLWIPGRNFDLLDLSADLLGIACAEAIARRLQPVGPSVASS